MRLSKFINKTFLKKVGKEADIIDSNYTIQNINIKDRHNIKRDELKEGDIVYAAISTTIKECKLEDFPRKAKIPNISILVNTKLKKARTSYEMLKDYFGV